MTFGRKILIFSFLLLPVLLITTYSFFQTRRQLVNKVYEDRHALTSLSAAMLNAKLDHLNDVGMSLSTRPVFRNFVNDRKWVDALDLMEEVPQHFSFIKQVSIADSSGNIVASHSKNDNTINVNQAGTNWYKGISKNWEPYLSEIHKIKGEQHIVTTLALPIKNDKGHITGILVLEVSVPDILAWSNYVSVGKPGFVYIVDQKGNIAVNPDYPEADSIINYSSVPAVQKALQGQPNTEILYNPIEKEQRLSSYQQLPRYKWAVILQQQATTALFVNNNLRTLLFFYAFIILLAVIFAWLIIKEITRRKKTEEQLSTYANMVDHTHVLVRGIDDSIKFWNKGMEELYGWTKEEVVGKNAQQLFATQFLQPLFEIKEQLLSYNQWVGELKHTRKDGRVIHVFSHWYLHRDENGNPLAVIETNNDITALKQTEEKLKKSEESIRLLIDNVKEYAIFMLDTEGRVVTWNNGATHIKGYTEKEVAGKRSDIFYTKKDVEDGVPQYNLEMAKEYGHFETEGWRLRKDGTKFWANIVFTALKDEAGILYGFSKITRDVTERRKIQEEKEFLSRLINRSNDAIYTLDADRKVKSWNRGAENLYGYTMEEMTGKDPHAILQTVITEEQTDKILKEIADKHYWTGDVKIKTKTGKDIWVQSSSTTILDNKGNLTGYVSVGFDITEQKKLRDEVTYLASIVEQSSEAIVSMGLDQRIITWNRGAEKLYGYSKEEAIGKASAALNIAHLPQNEIEELLQEVMEKGVWETEMQLFHKDGASFFGAVTANLIKNEKAEITSFNFIVKDISERKKLEEQLQEFEHFFNNSNDFSGIANKEGYFEVVNPSFVNALGYSQKELSENPFLNYVHPDDVAATLEVYDQLKSGALVLHFINRYHKKDGTYLWFDWNATPNPVTGKLYCIARDITDRKKAEHALTKLNEELEIKITERTEAINRSEKQYRYLFENNPMPMWIIDLHSFRFLDVNEMAIVRYGYSREDFLSMTALDIRPDEEKEAFKKADHSFKTNPTDYNKGIWNHRKKDGTIIQVEVIAHSILFKEVQARLILSNDVTEQKKAEKKLISSEERFRTLIENNYDIITLMDVSFNVIYRSPSTYRITGWKNEEMINEDGTKNMHPGDIEYFHYIVNKIMAQPDIPVQVSFRSRHKNGNYLWLEGTLTNLLHQENIKAIVFNARDVTERIEGEEKLKASEEQFRHSMDNMLEGVQIHDFDWKYVYVNNALAKYSKSTKEGLLGYSLTEKYPGIEKTELFQTMQRCMTERVTKHFETEFIFPDGSKTDFELSIQPVPEGLFILSIDITERKKAEHSLKELNAELEERVHRRTQELRKANEEMEAFSYSVSHDLRAPLRAIIGFANILEEDYATQLDDEAKRITSIIKNNTSKMGNLIDDLLTFSRMGRQDLLKINIDTNQIVHEVKEMLDKTNNNNKKIKWHIQQLPSINADISTIRQVWINLLSNAFKYSGSNPAPEIEVGAFRQNGQAVFYVKDNGVGFDEKYKNKLFKVFQRLHSSDEFEGTGIGLAIVDKIVSKHEGHVWAEGEINKGAKFYFSLPVK